MVETQNAIKLLRELKTNKFLPKYNVKIDTYLNVMIVQDQGFHDVVNEIKQEYLKINSILS